MTNKRFGKVNWQIDQFEKPMRKREDVTVQRGPAYTPEEADRLIERLAEIDRQAADAMEFIRATGCRAESIFGRRKNTGGKVVVDGKVIKEANVNRDFFKAVKAERIDLTKRTVTLCEKGGKWRTVQYDIKYKSLMERLVRENPHGNIFAGLKQPTLYGWIKNSALREGIEGRGLHGMRKTFAVKRHEEYVQRINEMLENKDWGSLTNEFPISVQKAKALFRTPYGKTIDVVARLRLSKDLGHNRVEVTYRYVPRLKK